MESNNQYKIKKNAAYLSLVVSSILFFAKMGAYLITGSAAVFSDAAESIVNILATSMAIVSIIISNKPADDSHKYGHGNIEYFSAGIEGSLIFVAAIIIIFQSISDIIKGVELHSLNIGLFVIGVAGLINLVLGYYLVNTGKKTDSLTLIADGKHILTDSVTSIGVLVGIFLVIITDISILDPIIAIAVALNILATAYKLIRVSIGGLMLETDPIILEKISGFLSRIKKGFWIDIHELRYWKSGDKVFIDFHIILPFYFTIEQTHREEKEIEEKLAHELNNSQVKIHFDYCRPELCRFCGYAACDVRKEEQTIYFNWDAKKLTGDAIFRIHA